MFGKVVGGLPVLDALEGREVGSGDKPIDAINILKATVFANPAADWDAAAPARVAEAARVEAEAEAAKSRGAGPKSWRRAPNREPALASYPQPHHPRHLLMRRRHRLDARELCTRRRGGSDRERRPHRFVSREDDTARGAMRT